MSFTKADGSKIQITFDRPLVGDVTGLNPVLGYKFKSGAQTDTPYVSSYYSSYTAAKLTDGGINTRWVVTSGAAGSYVKYTMPEPRICAAVKMYLVTTWYPKTMTIYGSNDDSTYTQLTVISGITVATNGYQTFLTNCTVAYKYYKVVMTEAAQSEIDIVEMAFSYPAGNEIKFQVTVPEYNYVPGGVIQDVPKVIKSVYAGAEATDVILEMEDLQRFESAAGPITISYAGGSLMGQGGPVAAFTQSFTPNGLSFKGDQNDAEHIEISSITPVATLTTIHYSSMQDVGGHVEVSTVTATCTLTNINDL